MKRSGLVRLAAITAAVMLAVLGMLNSNVGTRRASAFTIHTVTSTADGGAGSLRDAVNNASPGDTINFNLTLPATIILTSGAVSVNTGLTITGPGADQLTVSGNFSSRVFLINNNGSVAISGLTITHGTDLNTGAGILNLDSTLSVTACTFTNNETSGSASVGGALSNTGFLTVAGCTFNNNSALESGGGIFSNNAVVTVVNSTFTGNSATTVGGGALYSVGDGMTVVNCTISANSGGGIRVPIGMLNIENTIVADSMGGPDCASTAPVGVNSHNLIKDGSCSPMLSGNPMLGVLKNNGGPTQTMALLSGSPAIDAGDDSVLGPPVSLTTDQRGLGFPRKSGLHVDIGAFEFPSPPGPSFDTCLKDNTTGNLFQWNSKTGQYQFTRCSDNFTLSGTGTVALVNGIRTLTDRKPDRRISAGFNIGQLTGTAMVYLQVSQGVWQAFRVFDTNPFAVCKC
jgi:predicted outer membrane repeat protein